MLTGGTETGTVRVLLTSFPDTLWCPVFFVLSVSCDSLVRLLPLAPVKNKSQSITHQPFRRDQTCVVCHSRRHRACSALVGEAIEIQ